MKTIRHFAFMLLAAMVAVTAFAQQPTGSKSLTPVYVGEQIDEAFASSNIDLMAVEEPVGSSQTKTTARHADGNDEPVVVPDGLVLVDMYMRTYTNSTYVNYPIKCGADGTDFYFQGVCPELPEAWIKGTLDGTTLTLPAIQYLGQDPSDATKPIYFVGLNSTTSSDVTMASYPPDLHFRLNSGFWLSTANNTNGNSTGRTHLFSSVQFFPREELPTPPAGVEETTWKFNGSIYANSEWITYNNDNAKMIVSGNDVYIKGITSYAPDAWIKATKNNDGSFTIPSGTFIGYNGTSPLFLGGYGDGTFGKDMKFNFDGKATYTSDIMIIINGRKSTMSYFAYYSAGATLSQEVDEPVVAPDGLATEVYKMSYKSGADLTERDESIDVLVGFAGNDVYVQGIWGGLPNAWIKGTLDGNKVTFPTNQYLGSYSATYPDVYFRSFTLTTEGYMSAIDNIEFTYNSDTKSFESENHIAICVSKAAFSYFARYYIPLFSAVQDVAIVPQAPTITSFANNNLVFKVPTTGTEGEDMILDKLYYTVYSDVEREVNPITFDKATYTSLTEDMTEIPYNFSDYTNIGKSTAGDNMIIFKGGTENFNKIGVKATYKGGNAVNDSEITWFDIKDYSTELAGWVAKEQGLENAADLTSYEIDPGYTLTFKQGEGNNPPRYYNSGENARVYKNNMFEVAGKGILKVIVNYTPNYGGVVESDPTGVEQNDQENKWVWTGEADKVTFTNVSNASNLQLRIESIQVLHKQINPADLIAIDPAEGEVESLYNFAITFDGMTATCKDDAEVTLTKVGGEEPVYGMLEMSDDNKTVNLGLEYEVTEAGEYKLLIPAGAITVAGTEMPQFEFTYTIKAAAEDPDQLVQLPEGVTPEQWFGSGEWVYYSNGWQSEEIIPEEFPFSVAFSGDDIYIQGIDAYNPESWIKGTLTGNTLNVKSGQFTGSQVQNNEEFKFYVVGSESVAPYGIKDFAFTYDAEAGKLTCVPGVDPTVAPDPTSGSVYAYYTGLVLSRTMPEPDQVVTPPAGLETEDYNFAGNNITLSTTGDVEDSTPFNTTVKVGFDGNDVYMQGLSHEHNPEAWVKGTVNGNQMVFANGQLLGDFVWTYNGSNYDFVSYFCGANPTSLAVQDVVMTCNDDNTELTIADWIVINSKKAAISYFSIYGDGVLTKSSTGINTIEGDDSNAVYFDTMGRRVDSSARGLLIKQTRTADGKLKTVKVVK